MVILITGGSGSGKSAYTGQTVLDQGVARRHYTATTRLWDEECRCRIARHRRMWVDKGFETTECCQDLSHVTVEPESVTLLECMFNLLAGEYYREDASSPEVETRITAGIRHLQKQAKTLIIVTNEVFQDGTEYDEEIRRYQQILGHINQELAKLADEATEVVFGILVIVKKRGETPRSCLGVW